MPLELRFRVMCALGNSNIATLMTKTGSIPGVWTLRTRWVIPPIYASGFGLKEVVAALIKAERQASMYRANEGVTPLIVASREGHAEVVKELLRGGAAVNQAERMI